MQNRRCDVIRQIAVYTKRTARQPEKIRLQNIPGDYLNPSPFHRMSLSSLAQSGGQTRIGFNGYNAASFSNKQPRHLSVARANLDPNIVRTARQGRKNSSLPAWIFEEVLPQFLSCHGFAECSNAGNERQIAVRR